MRRVLALVSLALIALAAALWFQARSEPVVGPAIDALRPAVTTTAGVSAAPAVLELAPATLAQPRSHDSHLFGTVVDGTGAPLADARVWFFALDGRWAAGVVAPEIRVRGGPVAAFETHTRADGRFELRAPAPSGLRLRMEIESADHRGHVSRDLRASAEPNAKSIAAGENDFGKLVVPLRSAITGFVLARSGAPLAGANVGISPTGSGLFEATSPTETDGSFVLASVPAGEYALSASATGYLTHSFVVTLAPDRVLADTALVLDPTPSIAGRVLDLDGNPLSGVWVHAARDGRRDGDRQSSGTTREGRFELVLDEVAPHALWTESNTHEEWDSRLRRLPDFAPGTRDVEIRLAPLATTRVHVVDALTRQPVESFGLESVDRLESDFQWPGARGVARELTYGDLPQLRTQRAEGAWLTLDSPPQRVVIWSPGYKPTIEPLSHFPDQTLALAPLGGVRGAFVQDAAAPLTGSVLLVPADAEYADTALSLDLLDESPGGTSGRNHMGRLALGPSTRRVALAANGSFDIDDVYPATYRLLASVESPITYVRDNGVRLPLSHGRQSHRVRSNVIVGVGVTTDLGALELPSERASVRVVVLTSATQDTERLCKLLDASINGQQVPGSFSPEFSDWSVTGLAVGTFAVDFARDVPLLGRPRRWSVELAAEKESGLTVDLRGIETCVLHVPVAAVPVTAERVCVRLVPSSNEPTEGGVTCARRTLREGFIALAGTTVVVEVIGEKGLLKTSGPIVVPHAREYEVVFP